MEDIIIGILVLATIIYFCLDRYFIYKERTFRDKDKK